MIRAGRLKYVQTLAGLAEQLGVSYGTLRNKRLHAVEGHPDPISSPTARVQLWDAEQTAAFHAGKPVPALPDTDDDQDLLDRHEAALELGVSATTWNGYKSDPRLARHVILVPKKGDGALAQARRARVQELQAGPRLRRRTAYGQR